MITRSEKLLLCGKMLAVTFCSTYLMSMSSVPAAKGGRKGMRKFLKILGPLFLAMSVSVLSIFAPPKPTINDSEEHVRPRGETQGHRIEQEKDLDSEVR